MEDVRDTSSLRHSIGELITCPFCLDVWIATSFAIGFVFAPRVTRLVAATFTALTGGLVLAPKLTRLAATTLTATAVSDFLQMAYDMAKHAAEKD